MAAPKFFQNFYRGGIVFAVLSGLATLWLGYTSGNTDQIAAGVALLLTAAPVATSASRLTGQIKDGTIGNPGDAVIKGVSDLIVNKEFATSEIDRVLGAVAPGVSVTGVTEGLVGLGANAAGLLESLLAASRK